MSDDKATEPPMVSRPRLIADKAANVTIVDGDQDFVPTDAEKEAAQRFFTPVSRAPGFYWTKYRDGSGLKVRHWLGAPHTHWESPDYDLPADDDLIVVGERLEPPE